MQAILTKNLFRRTQATNEVDAQGHLDKGSVIDVVSIEEGKLIDGISTWYKAADGFFYWGGGVKKQIQTGITLAEPLQPGTDVTIRLDNILFSKLQIDKIWNDGETGQMATVAILDSGIALTCSDLTAAIGSGIIGDFEMASNRMKNFVTGSNTMEDDKGHGSHCAGLIASRNLRQAVGIAKGCKLYVGKITDSQNNPSVNNMIQGIRWAAGLEANSPQDIDIISMSSGSLLNMPDMKPTIDAALNKGKILVFSIGNRDPQSLPSGGTFPAFFENVISVAAVDFENNFQEYSYQSPNLTIACPGTGIMSYWIGGDTHIETGTSQSAAICSGVIALLVSKLKKKGETNISKRIMETIMMSRTKTVNGYTYRFIEPFQLYKTI